MTDAHQPLRATVSEDMSENDDHSDIDIDFDVRQMSLDAMKILESLSDEVNEIEKSSAKNRSRSASPSSSSKGSFRDDKKLDADIAEGTKVTPSPTKKYQNINDIDLGDDDDEDDDYSISDDSITKELDVLAAVTREIERELATQDTHTMRKAMLNVEASPDPRKSMLDSDDKEIIQKILDDELRNYEPKNAMERFLKRYQIEGFSMQEKTYFLSA